MLTLVEPCIMDNLLDQPHLGCAMLIAACQERGIRTTLLKGQTRYLKDMFVNDSRELWSLIQDLKKDDLKKTAIAEYKRTIQEKGIRQFQIELKGLYQSVIVDKNPRHYFNSQMVEKFNNLHNIFVAIYSYYLRRLNHNRLKIIDGYVSEIIKTNPRYIGFSLHGSFGPLSRIIRKRIKELTEIPIIVGGSLTPFIDLKKLDKTFEGEYFDYLVIGAGEHALPSLIEELDNKNEPKGIANVFYKKDSKIKGNDLEVINDLDSLPYPDFSQFDLDLYLTPKRILPLQTARGCSWRKCAFCNEHKNSLGRYRVFSIEKIIETIRYLNKAYRCQFFTFNQADLTSSQARRISKSILRNKLENIYIYSFARLEEGYNDSACLGLMRKAGFVQFGWGMESGNQRILNSMNKGTSIKTISQILKKSFNGGISNICFIIFGFPGETKQEAQQTVDFLKKHAKYINDIICNPFELLSDSPIREIPRKWGLNIKDDGSYVVRSGMNPEESNKFSYKFSREFKLNITKTSSNRLKYISVKYWQRFTRFFLISGHDILSDETLMKYLERKRFNDIFPMILGRVETNGEEAVLFPINIKETMLLNQYFPENTKVLDSLKEKVFVLSAGTLSIEDIILTVYKEFRSEYRKKYIRKKCIDFFQEAFSKNWALGFEKSWHLS